MAPTLTFYRGRYSLRGTWHLCHMSGTQPVCGRWILTPVRWWRGGKFEPVCGQCARIAGLSGVVVAERSAK